VDDGYAHITGYAVNWLWVADELSGFDPFRREVKLELESIYYPLGFPLRLATNCTEINKAAEEIWGRYPQAFETPPLRLRVAMESGGEHPPAPVYRGQEHLMMITADARNFAVCDHTRSAAFCWLNDETVRDRPFTGYYFLEAMANYCLTQLYLTPVHGACVARNGRGVLLCGASGAGKTSLAYFCARNGWTYISDNESWGVEHALVRAASKLVSTAPGSPVLLGNPNRIRFRDNARDLFPELKRYRPAQDTNGKMSISITPAEIDIAYQCAVERVVMLRRRPYGPANVRSLPRDDVFGSLISELPLYDNRVRKRQSACLRKVAELEPVELRYSRLEDALRRLESLLI
jgi:hypothetical protein